MTPTQPHAALRDYLLASPAADRIALARELLKGTGRVVAVQQNTIVGTPKTGIRIVRTQLVEDPTP